MKTPAIIAARNEEEHIGRTLAGLEASAVEPFVVANGCKDQTAEIAQGYGANVYKLEEPGKLPAIQFALGKLGAERASEPVLLLDADTHPLMPRRWESSMLKARSELPADAPAVVIGSMLFANMVDPITSAWKNLTHARHQFRTKDSTTRGSFSGGNMLLDLNDDNTREAMLSLPNIWPGNDVALKDTVIRHGGNALKSLDIRTAAVTDGARYPSFVERLVLGSSGYRRLMVNSYNIDAAPNSISYSEWAASALATNTND